MANATFVAALNSDEAKNNDEAPGILRRNEAMDDAKLQLPDTKANWKNTFYRPPYRCTSRRRTTKESPGAHTAMSI